MFIGRYKVTAIVKVREVDFSYGDKEVLKDINFDIYEGEIFGIIGGSGSGKSTILKLVVGLIRPTKGSIIVDGIDITKADEKGYFSLIRKFGILFQNSGLIGSMTVEENILLPLLQHTKLPIELLSTIVKARLSIVGLPDVMHLYPSELSGGMRKRVGLARAMALSPKLLFLDEPSSGLDPITSAALDDLILNINKKFKTTIVIVTHDLESIFHTLNRAIVLDTRKKGIIAEGAPKELMAKPANAFVESFFHRRPMEL